MYIAVTALITLLTALLPVIVPPLARRFGLKLHHAPVWLPILAAFLWAIAGRLPDIHISHETNSFQEHFVGGGLYTAVLFVYFTKLLSWRPNWLLTLIALFAWTSALGTLNELLEFTLVKLNLARIDITETSWDLTANTVGMLAGYLLYVAARNLAKRRGGLDSQP